MRKARLGTGPPRARTQIRSFFCNMPLWLPVMEAYEARKPSYFATPACNLIGALRVGLEQMQDYPDGMDGYFRAHRENKTKLHKIITQAPYILNHKPHTDMGLSLLTDSSEVSSNLLSCIKYPPGKGPEILPIMKKKGWILAGGLHPEVGGTYFRMGHMGYSVTTKPEWCTDLLKDLQATFDGK
ncbi:pyridoxal phosphate-dependent transferase [Baffinella frigidus]|nr:pyridoxal phosphate-dependent transferase [Cryptophyta sp. CCMP2293]